LLEALSPSARLLQETGAEEAAAARKRSPTRRSSPRVSGHLVHHRRVFGMAVIDLQQLTQTMEISRLAP
jgi:hypothetical protein